jgi:hypothetical protein
MSKKSSSGKHDVLIATPCTETKWLRDWRKEEAARRQDANCAVTLASTAPFDAEAVQREAA